MADDAKGADGAAAIADATPVEGEGANTLLDATVIPTEGGEAQAAEVIETEESPVVPESYTDFTLPEGQTLDAEQATAFKTLAKDLGLTQESAQKLVDFNVASEASKADAMNETIKSLKAETAALPNKDALLVDARRAIERLAVNDETKELFLKNPLLANHPGVIQLLAKAGALTKEAKVIDGGNVAPDRNDPMAMYPSMKNFK